MALLDVVLVIMLTLTGAVLLERRKIKPGGGVHATPSAPPAEATSQETAAAPQAKPKSYAQTLFGGGESV